MERVFGRLFDVWYTTPTPTPGKLHGSHDKLFFVLIWWASWGQARRGKEILMSRSEKKCTLYSFSFHDRYTLHYIPWDHYHQFMYLYLSLDQLGCWIGLNLMRWTRHLTRFWENLKKWKQGYLMTYLWLVSACYVLSFAHRGSQEELGWKCDDDDQSVRFRIQIRTSPYEC